MPFAVKKKNAVPVATKPAGRFTVKSRKELEEPSVENGCPRKPMSAVCGYGGVDAKGKKYDVCTLPEGHSGPHGQVEAPEVEATVLRREQSTCPVAVKTDATIDGVLTDTLYGWKLAGSDWMTSLEADLQVFSKGYRFENKISLDAVRTLCFLGYMISIKADNNGFGTTRYKLSKKGLETVAEIARLIGDTKVVEDVASSNEAVCGNCGGDGYDEENDEVCAECGGVGTVKKKVVIPRRTAKDVAHSKITAAMAEQLKAKQIQHGTVKLPTKAERASIKSLPENKGPKTLLEIKYMTVGDIKQAKGQKLAHGDAFRLASSVMHDCPDPDCDGGVYFNGTLCGVCLGDAEVDYNTLDAFNANTIAPATKFARRRK